MKSDATEVTVAKTGGVSDLWALIKSWKWKSIEKCAAYAAALVVSTKGFDTLSIPTNTRNDLIIVAGVVIAALHVGTDD
jgi:hypothetical protein